MTTYQIPTRRSSANEAIQVAREATVIREALKKCGYETRKKSKQPVWKIFVAPNDYYKLAYQPAPISAWELYPQNDNPSRQGLLTIIQKALSEQPSGIFRKVS